MSADPRPRMLQAIRDGRFRASTSVYRPRQEVPDYVLLQALADNIYECATGEVVLQHGATSRIAREHGVKRDRVLWMVRKNGIRIGQRQVRDQATRIILREMETGVLPYGAVRRITQETGMSKKAVQSLMCELREGGIEVRGTRNKPHPKKEMVLGMLAAAANPEMEIPKGTHAHIAAATGSKLGTVRQLAWHAGYRVRR